MKKCPQCGREYDLSMSFCLDDGAELLYGPAADDERATAILHETEPTSEAKTRAQIHTTEQTAVLRSGRAARKAGGSFGKHILAISLTLAVILAAGFLGYRYFSASAQINSIAVMPFVNESGDPDAEYLGDGMTETLIKDLSAIPGVSVKGRSSVFRYKGREADARSIGKELGVQAVLFGRVVPRGDQISLSLELLDADTENVIWSDKYDRSRSDLVTLQSQIAKDLSSKLKAKLSPAVEAKVTRAAATNAEAYQLYLQGRYQLNLRTVDSFRKAVEFFRAAIERDPSYAQAYAGLAEAYAIFPIWSVARPKDAMPQAKAAAQRALELDETIAQAHVALALYLNYFEFDRAGAERAARRAIELEPNYSTGYECLAVDILSPLKRYDEALAAIDHAQELDPLSPPIGTNAGWILIDARRFDDAIERLKRVLSVNPNYPYAIYVMAYALDGKGLYEQAAVEYRRSLALNDDPFVKALLARTLAKSGKRDEALAIIAELRSESTKRFVPGYSLAIAYLALGKREEALESLETDIAERSPFVSYIACQFMLDDLRSDPRFRQMLRRINLPE